MPEPMLESGTPAYAPTDVAQKIEIVLLKDGRLITSMPIQNTLLCYELLIAALHVAQEEKMKAQRTPSVMPGNGNLVPGVRMPR